MNEGAPPPGGLNGHGASRRRWPRRTPYGIRRESTRPADAPASANDEVDGTYAALDLGAE